MAIVEAGLAAGGRAVTALVRLGGETVLRRLPRLFDVHVPSPL